MVNAWSLLYDELYGDDEMSEKKSKYWYDHDRNTSYDWGDDGFSMTENPNASPDTICFGDSKSNDTIALTGSRVPGGAGDDHIYFTGSGDPYPTLGSMSVDSFTPDLSHRKPAPNLKSTVSKKYQEDVGIKDLKDYVSSTYQGHYTNDSSDVQTLDLIHSVGDAESFCRSNALKYLSRYDKKGQAKRDILKAMHYCLLLYYFSGNTNNETPSRGYETF